MPADHPLVPPRLALHLLAPRLEMFQSSCMSWSSITIELDTVESSQRITGRSTPPGRGGCTPRSRRPRSGARRAADRRARDELEGLGGDLVGVDLVAAQEEQVRIDWVRPPRAGSGQGVQGVEPAPVLLVLLLGKGVGGLLRQPTPGTSRTRARSARRSRNVRSTLGGNPEPSSGQTRSPSSATSYSSLDPGSRSSNITSP